MSAHQLNLFAIPAIPLIGSGDDLAGLICTAADDAELTINTGDILVIAQWSFMPRRQETCKALMVRFSFVRVKQATSSY